MPIREHNLRYENNKAYAGTSDALSEFTAGFGERVKAPLVGVKQITEGLTPLPSFISAANAGDTNPPPDSADKPVKVALITSQTAEDKSSKARLAGEMAGGATVFIAATALLHRLPGKALEKALAPIVAGGLIGLLEPVMPGQAANVRLTRAAEGAFSIAAIEHGPKVLTKLAILKSEQAVAGAFLSGAVVGAASEQASSLIQSGQFSSFDRTTAAAFGFGLVNGAFRGANLALGKGVEKLSAQSIASDQMSMKGIAQVNRNSNLNDQPWHLVLGSGGSHAFLTGSGVVVACKEAGIKLGTIGGISGGTMPASFAAADLSSAQILKIAKEMDATTLINKKPWFARTTKIMADNKSGSKTQPLDVHETRGGMYGTTKVAAEANKHVPEWPERFWTMAVAEKSQIFMSAKGIYEYPDKLMPRIVSNKPISVGDAVRASSAIPGLFEGLVVNGRTLFDGALGRFGKCPTDLVASHLNIPKERIIASLRVGAMTTTEKAQFYVAQFFSGNFQRHSPKIVQEAGIVIRPEVKSFGSLNFNLNAAQKEEALLAGYRSAIEEFGRNKLISASKLTELRAAGQSLQALEQSVRPTNQFPILYTGTNWSHQ
ncbi:hypothetical protein KBI23_26770 [bacterium]|nr:hypothetical protein [bacterium]MBP9811319.1 hypothetical protein [bacterium]